jgi:drug/metabolite transporter (DMT)-like permease
VALAVGSALSFGITIVFNRSLAQSGLGVSTSLGYRFGTAAVVLLLVIVARGPRRGSVLPAPGERLRVFLLGALGYAFEATLFFLALGRGSAAAVGLLFYTYPAMVMVAEIVLGTERAHVRSFVALALAGAGSVVVVAAGTAVTISPVGVTLALGSAAATTVFLLASSRLVVRSDALTTGAWMTLGAACSFLAHGLVTGTLHSPGGYLPTLLGNGAATTSAFVLLFAAMRLIGPTRTSVVMTLEAFFAIVLAAIFLGEGIQPVQALGGLAILAATAVIAAQRNRPVMVPASPGRPRK